MPGFEAAASLACATAAFDLPRIEAAVREILLAVGEDPDREGLSDTPRRVAKAYAEMLSGLRQSPADHLSRTFEQDTDEPVILRDIPFTSLCEHHLLPFVGTAHVAYQPGEGRVVGLSKLARTVEVLARRPQMQERLTQQVADALMTHAGATGAAVIIEGEHYCMKMRGINKSGATMLTSAFRGCFADDTQRRNELMTMLNITRHAGCGCGH
ncbi:MAG: GTP cyclohydrolase I FolE [Planctomycetes bacterium]|nr:GTP cyclohydrolase I FolE [Planctomycetota bacterium]